MNELISWGVVPLDKSKRAVDCAALDPKMEYLHIVTGVGETVKHARGVVSMARWEDPNSAQSSFSLVLGPAPHLDGKYTIFGKVVKGWEVLDKIEELAGAAPRKPKAVVPIYKIRSVKPTTREANADK
ncbi:MAG: cyclophilin family peptidyl-prolyl cis-trans isomerase [Limisphaerales bacterium]